MAEYPSISVVIPCFNSEAFVEACIRSVLDQTYALEEIICIDDGSSDGTLDILRAIRDSGEELTIRSQKNQGISAARNAGLKMATGEYIAFLDHDDILHPDKLKHQAQLIGGSPFRPDFVAAAYTEVWPEYDPVAKVRSIYSSDPWIGLIHARIGRTSSNLWRASSVRRAGGWQATDGLSLDTGLMFRMLKNGCRIIWDAVPLTTRYTLPSSASRMDRATQWATFLQMRTEIFRYVEANDLLTPERQRALHGDMFRAIRGLYEYDRELALQKHDELERMNFRLSGNSLGPGRLYRVLYTMLGFRWAERLYPLWLKAREAAEKGMQGGRMRSVFR